ncbi:Serine/arginine repetitive matrix protein 2 [Linum grandiflorum]
MEKLYCKLGRARKRPRRSKGNSAPADRLSDLPDCILYHILSFVKTVDAVKTCVLSRRWRCVWKYVPVLELDPVSFPEYPKFETFVHRVLSHLYRLKVDEVRLVDSDHQSPKLYREVIQYANSHETRHLVMRLKRYVKFGYLFGSTMYCHIETLHLRHTGFEFEIGHSSFPKLATLKLDRCLLNLIPVDGGDHLDLSANFPRLTNLYITECNRRDSTGSRIKISAPQLLNLRLYSGARLNIEIVAPRLKFISFEYVWPLGDLGFPYDSVPYVDPAEVLLDCMGCFMDLPERYLDTCYQSLLDAKSVVLLGYILKCLVVLVDASMAAFFAVSDQFESAVVAAAIPPSLFKRSEDRMYNGIGLQTPRGSGTNGHIQTNKFFIRPRTDKVAHTSKGFGEDQGTGGITKKPNKDILEHDRKRQIQLKLVVLEDKLIDQGFTDAEIAEKLEEARGVLEAASASEESGGPGDSKYSNTQSHQIAARKEKQMETLRAAFGIQSADPNKEVADMSDDGMFTGERGGPNDGKMWNEKPEHAFLDRDFERKKDVAEVQDLEKDDKKRSTGALKGKKKHQHDSPVSSSSAEEGELIRSKHRKGRHGSSDEADSESDYGKKKRGSKKHRKGREQARDSDDSSDDSDSDVVKGKKNSRRHNKRRRSSSSDDSSDSKDTDSDNGKKKNKKKNKKKSKPRKSKKIRRRDSESDDSSADDSDRDVIRNNAKAESEKRRKSDDKRPDLDSDDDSSSDSGSPKRRLEQVREHAKARRRHDSDDEYNADALAKEERMQDKRDSRGKLGNGKDEIREIHRRDGRDDKEARGRDVRDAKEERGRDGRDAKEARGRDGRDAKEERGRDGRDIRDGRDKRDNLDSDRRDIQEERRENREDLGRSRRHTREEYRNEKVDAKEQRRSDNRDMKEERGRNKMEVREDHESKEPEMDKREIREEHGRDKREIREERGRDKRDMKEERGRNKMEVREDHESEEPEMDKRETREEHGRDKREIREERGRDKREIREEHGRDKREVRKDHESREEHEMDKREIREERGRDKREVRKDHDSREEREVPKREIREGRGGDKRDVHESREALDIPKREIREERGRAKRDDHESRDELEIPKKEIREERGREKREVGKDHESREERQMDKREIREEHGRDKRDSREDRQTRTERRRDDKETTGERGRDRKHGRDEDAGSRIRSYDRGEAHGEKRKSYTDKDDVKKRGIPREEEEPETKASEHGHLPSSKPKRARYDESSDSDDDRRRDSRRGRRN